MTLPPPSGSVLNVQYRVTTFLGVEHAIFQFRRSWPCENPILLPKISFDLFWEILLKTRIFQLKWDTFIHGFSTFILAHNIFYCQNEISYNESDHLSATSIHHSLWKYFIILLLNGHLRNNLSIAQNKQFTSNHLKEFFKSRAFKKQQFCNTHLWERRVYNIIEALHF